MFDTIETRLLAKLRDPCEQRLPPKGINCFERYVQTANFKVFRFDLRRRVIIIISSSPYYIFELKNL